MDSLPLTNKQGSAQTPVCIPSSWQMGFLGFLLVVSPLKAVCLLTVCSLSLEVGKEPFQKEERHGNFEKMLQARAQNTQRPKESGAKVDSIAVLKQGQPKKWLVSVKFQSHCPPEKGRSPLPMLRSTFVDVSIKQNVSVPKSRMSLECCVSSWVSV